MIPPYRCLGSGFDWSLMVVSGARTATAMYVRPRIMTPSSTACPPYEIFGVRLCELPGASTAASERGSAALVICPAPPVRVPTQTLHQFGRAELWGCHVAVKRIRLRTLLRLLQAPLETLDLTSGIDEPLLASKEG